MSRRDGQGGGGAYNEGDARGDSHTDASKHREEFGPEAVEVGLSQSRAPRLGVSQHAQAVVDVRVRPRSVRAEDDERDCEDEPEHDADRLCGRIRQL